MPEPRFPEPFKSRRNERGHCFSSRRRYVPKTVVTALKGRGLELEDIRRHCRKSLTDYVTMVQALGNVITETMQADREDEIQDARAKSWIWKAWIFISQQTPESLEERESRSRARAARFAFLRARYVMNVQAIASMRRLRFALQAINEDIADARALIRGETTTEKLDRLYREEQFRRVYVAHQDEAFDEVTKFQKMLAADFDARGQDSRDGPDAVTGGEGVHSTFLCTHTDFWRNQGSCEECVDCRECHIANRITYWCPACGKKACAACQRLVTASESGNGLNDLRMAPRWFDVFIAGVSGSKNGANGLCEAMKMSA